LGSHSGQDPGAHHPGRLVAFLDDLATKIETAGRDAEVEDLYDAARSMERHVHALPMEGQDAWRRLAELVDQTSTAE
jgi:hypothetical protein